MAFRLKRFSSGFSLIELLAGVGILSLLATLAAPHVMRMVQMASTAIAAHTLRELAVASQAALTDSQQQFWRYAKELPGGDVEWWFGFESAESRYVLPEGSRVVDLTRGPLGPYMAAAPGRHADPTFLAAGKAFKPKFRNCFFPYGYNKELEKRNLLTLEKPGSVVVFATSAQVNTFQPPASFSNPMLEEFYFIDRTERTVHFRIGGRAMVIFANWSAGFLEMDPSTRDKKMPKANVGRFAPKNSLLYLQ